MKKHPHLKMILQWLFNTALPVWIWRSGVNGLHDWYRVKNPAWIPEAFYALGDKPEYLPRREATA